MTFDSSSSLHILILIHFTSYSSHNAISAIRCSFVLQIAKWRDVPFKIREANHLKWLQTDLSIFLLNFVKWWNGTLKVYGIYKSDLVDMFLCRLPTASCFRTDDFVAMWVWFAASRVNCPLLNTIQTTAIKSSPTLVWRIIRIFRPSISNRCWNDFKHRMRPQWSTIEWTDCYGVRTKSVCIETWESNCFISINSFDITNSELRRVGRVNALFRMKCRWQVDVVRLDTLPIHDSRQLELDEENDSAEHLQVYSGEFLW